MNSSAVTPRFDKLLIANRGEIAVRVNRAAQELGLRTVAVYSEADANSLVVQLADEAVLIGPAQATRSYLNIDALLEAARQTGAGALASRPALRGVPLGQLRLGVSDARARRGSRGDLAAAHAPARGVSGR